MSNRSTMWHNQKPFDDTHLPIQWSLKWLILIFIQLIIITPLFLNYFFEVILIIGSVFLLYSIFTSIEDGLSLLPIFIYLPFAITSLFGLQFSEIGVLLVFFSFLGSILLAKTKIKFETPGIIPIALFILAAVLSVLNAKYLGASIKNIIKLLEAFIFILYLTANTITEKKSYEKILLLIVLGGVLEAFYGFYLFKTGGEATTGWERRIFGMLGGGYGGFLSISIICGLAIILWHKGLIAKTFCIISLPLLVVALILSQTRAWYGAFILGFFLLIYQMGLKKYSLKITSIVIISITLITVLISTNFFGYAPGGVLDFAMNRAWEMGASPMENKGKYLSSMMRLFIWWQGFTIYLQHPIFGFGIGNLRFRNYFTGELGAPSDRSVGYVDNHYLNIWYETGILGAISWIMLLVMLAKTAKRVLHRTQDTEWHGIAVAVVASILIFLAGGVFWCLTAVHEMTVMLAFLIGLLFSLDKNIKSSSVVS